MRYDLFSILLCLIREELGHYIIIALSLQQEFTGLSRLIFAKFLCRNLITELDETDKIGTGNLCLNVSVNRSLYSSLLASLFIFSSQNNSMQ